MSDQPYRVGYRTPPRNRQFKPGQSGNPRGRPRKPRDTIDALGILDQPVTVREGGHMRQMQPKEVALRQLLKRALKGDDLQALLHLIDEFERHGVFDVPARRQENSVVALPSDMPSPMAKAMAIRFGRPPWTDAQLAQGRMAYLADRDVDQARLDDLLGYQVLLRKDL